METQKENYRISDDKNVIQLDRVENLLRDSYWAENRELTTIKSSIENSICFSLFDRHEQIGFARVVTDNATMAYICDIIVEPGYRRQGLGKWLTGVIVNDPRWASLFQILTTDDAQDLYAKFSYENSNRLMCRRPENL